MIKVLLARVIDRYESITDIFHHPKAIAYVSALVIFINQYIFSQWSFAVGFFGIFIFDTITGIYIAWRTNIFSIKVLREKLMDKCVVYFTIIISYSMATKIVLEGDTSIYIEIFNVPVYGILVGSEFISILRSWYNFKKWAWLKKLMIHFNAFEENPNKELV